MVIIYSIITMEVVKAFNANELHTEIIIKGTFEEPLFRASDIGAVLELSNINSIIRDFDESEKVLTNSDTLGGNQQVSFLTEKGLYKVLFRSRKPIAEKFQNWVCEIVKEIRLNGQYKLNDEIKELQATLEQKSTELENKDAIISKTRHEKQRAVEQATIAHFPVNTECVYFGTIENKNEGNSEEKLLKFGHTNDLATRVADHRKKYIGFVLVEAFRVQNKVEIENLIKTHPKIRARMRTIEVLGKIKTEIIAYDTTIFTLNAFAKHIRDIIHSKTYSIDNFNRLMHENEVMTEENTELKKKVVEDEKTITKLTLENEQWREKAEKQEKQLVAMGSDAKESDSVFKSVLLPDDDLHKRFDEFVKTCCIVRPDVEEYSVGLEGRYRLWSQVKPTKEAFHALKNYLDIRFKAKRIKTNHGYGGIKLREMEISKQYPVGASTPETFVFNSCVFSDYAKVLNTTLLVEYRKWKLSVGQPIAQNEVDDMRELKTYLNASPYALKATVHKDSVGNEGYYGLDMKGDLPPGPQRVVATSGKRVEKRCAKTNVLLATWESIAKAAQVEGMCAAKMSRLTRFELQCGEHIYRVMV